MIRPGLYNSKHWSLKQELRMIMGDVVNSRFKQACFNQESTRVLCVESNMIAKFRPAQYVYQYWSRYQPDEICGKFVL